MRKRDAAGVRRRIVAKDGAWGTREARIWGNLIVATEPVQASRRCRLFGMAGRGRAGFELTGECDMPVGFKEDRERSDDLLSGSSWSLG